MVEQADKTVLLSSSDGAEFVVSELEATQSMYIQQEIKFKLRYEKAFGKQSDPAIHLAVKGNVLSKVVEYCRGSHVASAGDDDLHSWGAQFIDVDLETLCDLIMVSCCIYMLYSCPKLVGSDLMIRN